MPTTIFKYISLVFLFISLSIDCNSQISFNGSTIKDNSTIDNDTLFSSSKLNNFDSNNNTYAFVKGADGEYKLKVLDSKTLFGFRMNNSLLDSSYSNTLNNYYYSISKKEKVKDNIYTKKSTATSSVSTIDTIIFIPQLNKTRRIWIYLPSGYSKSNKKYPVIYMHDGQNIFDSYTSFAGEWKVDETVDELIKNGSKKAIIVAIDNGSENRLNEYTPFPNKEYGGGDGSKYMDFVVNTLKPYIDNNFKTLSDRDNTSIMGSSLGGLISFYGIMKYKSIFSKAVIMSPSFWYSNKIYFIPSNSSKYPIELFFIAGDKESKTMLPNIEKMVEKLDKMKYPSESYKVKIIRDGKHNEKLWGGQFADAYKWIVE